MSSRLGTVSDRRGGLSRASFYAVLIAASLVVSCFALPAAPALGLSWVAAAIAAHLLGLTILMSNVREPSRLPVPAALSVVSALLLFGVWAPATVAGSRAYGITTSDVPLDAFRYTTYAVLLVLVGCALPSVASLRPRSPKPIPSGGSDRTVALRRLGKLLLVAGGASFVGYAVLVGQSPATLFIVSSDPVVSSAGINSIPGFLLAGVDLATPGALLLIATRSLGRRSTVVSVGAVVIFYFALGFKYRVAVLLIAALCVYIGPKTRSTSRSARIVLGVLLATVALAVTSYVRGNHELATIGESRPLNISTLAGASVRSIDISTSYALLHERNYPALRGRSYAEIPLLLVPRALLPSKPQPAVIEELQAVTLPGVGAAMPLWAEADANFGLAGLVAFGFILGVVVRWVDALDRGDPHLLVVGATLTALLPSVLSRTIMFWALWQTAITIGPVLLARRSLRRSLQV